MCKELLDLAIKKQKNMGSPILAYPSCHPKSYLDVHVDGNNRIIYLSCAACDRLVSVIKLKEPINAKLDT